MARDNKTVILTIRVERWLKERLRKEAQKRGLTLSGLVRMILIEKLRKL